MTHEFVTHKHEFNSHFYYRSHLRSHPCDECKEEIVEKPSKTAPERPTEVRV